MDSTECRSDIWSLFGNVSCSIFSSLEKFPHQIFGTIKRNGIMEQLLEISEYMQ